MGAAIGALATAVGIIFTLYHAQKETRGYLKLKLECKCDKIDPKCIIAKCSVENTNRKTFQIDFAYLLINSNPQVESRIDEQNKIRDLIKKAIKKMPIDKQSRVIPLGRRKVDTNQLKNHLGNAFSVKSSQANGDVLLGQYYSIIFLPYYYKSNRYIGGFELQSTTTIHKATTVGSHSIAFFVMARRKKKTQYLESRFVDDQLLIP
jgi:hypothetical protein